MLRLMTVEDQRQLEQMHFKLVAPPTALVTCGGYLPKIQLQVKDAEDFSDYVNLELTSADFDLILDNEVKEKMHCGGQGVFFKMNEEEQGILQLDGDRLILKPKHDDGTSLGTGHVKKGRVVRITVNFFLAKDMGGSYERTDQIGTPQSFNITVVPGPPSRLDLYTPSKTTGKRPLSQSSQGSRSPGSFHHQSTTPIPITNGGTLEGHNLSLAAFDLWGNLTSPKDGQEWIVSDGHNFKVVMTDEGLAPLDEFAIVPAINLQGKGHMEVRSVFTLSDHTKKGCPRLGSSVELRFRVNAADRSDEEDDEEDEEEEENAEAGKERPVCKGDTVIKEWHDVDSKGKKIKDTSYYHVHIVKSKSKRTEGGTDWWWVKTPGEKRQMRRVEARTGTIGMVLLIYLIALVQKRIRKVGQGTKAFIKRNNADRGLLGEAVSIHRGWRTPQRVFSDRTRMGYADEARLGGAR